jgi:hypothetical protein
MGNKMTYDVDYLGLIDLFFFYFVLFNNYMFISLVITIKYSMKRLMQK